MPEALFLFVQLEYPWLLGPPDGRYLLRSDADADPERVVVLGRLAAERAPERAARAPLLRRGGRRRALSPTTPAPAPVPTARVTIVDPVPLSAERQAQAWLDGVDPEKEADAAVAVLNRILHLYRLSAADPHVSEVSAAQALVIRLGWGEGEQVADGHWLYARELAPTPNARGSSSPARLTGRRSGRGAALGHEIRFAGMLGGRTAALLCEELALRARLDLDQGRLRHAAIELDRALASAARELAGENHHDLALRVAELEKLHRGVSEQAALALAPDGTAAPSGGLDGEALGHALGRLEAALRARAAQQA
jgi:hypothetical protein